MSSPFPFDWVAAHAEARPDAPAVDTPEGRLSYGELWRRTRLLAAMLRERGVAKGDFVLFALPHVPAAVVGALAAQLCGACAVEVNREWGEAALTDILRQTRAKVAFVAGRDARLWGTLAKAAGLSSLVVVHPGALPPKMREAFGPVALQPVREDGTPEGVAETDAAPPPPASLPRDPEGPALLVYTSGSTGTPRAVVQTFRNVAANTRSIVSYLGLTAEDRALLFLPLFYCYGRSVLQTHLFVGGSVFLENRAMYPRVVMEALASEGCTGFAGVPLTFELIKRQVDVSVMRFPRLRYVTQAGGGMHPETTDWARAAFAPARLFVMYGQTEATARLSYLPPERAVEKRGSIGIAIPDVTLRVVDESGRELPRGEVGQLVARGENVTPGYFGAPEETAAILRDGWLWTGDLARQDDDGFFFVVGRAKDILKLGGHRVSPVEIEEALATHPDVLEVAVVGVPDPVSGEAAVAFVVLQANATFDAAKLGHFAREKLPLFKVPRRFVPVERLPRTAAGKVQKESLRAHAASGGLANPEEVR